MRITKEKPRDVLENPMAEIVRNLICAMIIQAIEDYQKDRKSLKRKLKRDKRESVKQDIADIKKFLKSGICESVGIPSELVTRNLYRIEIPKGYKSSVYAENYHA